MFIFIPVVISCILSASIATEVDNTVTDPAFIESTELPTTSTEATTTPIPQTPLNQLLMDDLTDILFTKETSTDLIMEKPPSFTTVFHTQKSPISFYLWPRDECQVVELIGLTSFENGKLVASDEKIVFKTMEQRVEYYKWEDPVALARAAETTTTGLPTTTEAHGEEESTQDIQGAEQPTEGTTESTVEPTTTQPIDHTQWVLKSAEYYPYVKVDFNKINGQYQLLVRGENSEENGRCEISKCMPEKSEIKFAAADNVLLMSNSPYCEIHPIVRNQDIPANDFWRPTIEVKEYLETRKLKGDKNTRSGHFPLHGMKVGDLENKKTEQNRCCPESAKMLRNDKQTRWHVNNTHATAYKYRFENKKQENSHKSFLVELQDPEKCDWIRLCFDVDGCYHARAIVDILPRSGLLIRPDDDRAEYLGELDKFLTSFRVSIYQEKLVIRYSNVNSLSAGINTPISMHQNQPIDKYIIWLVKSPGCKARLNNDGLGASASRKRRVNDLKMKECKCFIQPSEE